MAVQHRLICTIINEIEEKTNFDQMHIWVRILLIV